jgi:hypothetical protein
MIHVIVLIIAFIATMTSNTNVDETYESQNIEIQFNYYEYRNVRDKTNNYFNLRVTYDLCDQFNDDDTTRYLCKQRAYERAITIDA